MTHIQIGLNSFLLTEYHSIPIILLSYQISFPCNHQGRYKIWSSTQLYYRWFHRINRIHVYVIFCLKIRLEMFSFFAFIGRTSVLFQELQLSKKYFIHLHKNNNTLNIQCYLSKNNMSCSVPLLSF